jgi:hypothetical protein
MFLKSDITAAAVHEKEKPVKLKRKKEENRYFT